MPETEYLIRWGINMLYYDVFEYKQIVKSGLLAYHDCFFTTKEFVLTAADRPDLEETAKENRKLLETTLKGKIHTAKQVHGTHAEIVQPGKYLYENTDALISNTPGDILLMNFADCVPIILYDLTTNTGAIVHAGWRGTADEIVSKTVQKLNDELNVRSEDIIALIGPSIGKCCFETDEDVFDKLVKDKNDTDLYDVKAGRYFPDLKMINYKQLVNSGVRKIDTCNYCTSCMSDVFFSYRKENGICGRHSAVVQIKREEE